MSLPLLVVLAGQPGTGKTTLARRLASELHAAYLRIDAIETAIIRCRLGRPPLGPIGYVVARELAAATLSLGTPVVIDAVNPVPEARAGWHLLETVGALVVFETMLPDPAEHRRRVEQRRPDLVDQDLPTWAQVEASEYEQWDQHRDGPRHLVDMTRTEPAVALALDHLDLLAAES